MAEYSISDEEQRKQRIIGMFNRVAPTYDHAGPSFFAHFGQGLVDFAQIKPGDKVLDIATGRGASLFPAALVSGSGGQITGTDLSETMVIEARKEARRRKVKNVHIKRMDAERLQFPDGSFDTVLCGFGLFFFPRFEIALAEMRRVLKPGGCLAVTTWQVYEDERWKWFGKIVEAYLPSEETKSIDPGSQKKTADMASSEGMRAIFGTAGFMELQTKVEWFDVIYQDEEQWWAAQWSHGGRRLLEKIESTCGVNGLERFRIEVFEGMKGIKQGDGIHTIWPALFTKGIKPGQ